MFLSCVEQISISRMIRTVLNSNAIAMFIATAIEITIAIVTTMLMLIVVAMFILMSITIFFLITVGFNFIINQELSTKPSACPLKQHF